MKNITTTLKKLLYIWRKSQVPLKLPIRISKIDNLIIFLICILISIISSYKLLDISPLNISDIFSWIFNFTEALISSWILILVSKKENPTISSRQIIFIITLLLANFNPSSTWACNTSALLIGSSNSSCGFFFLVFELYWNTY